MAEEVIIGGIGNGPPDFATETTQRQVLQALKAAGIAGLDSSDMNNLISAISNGDDNVVDTLKKIQVTNSKSSNTLGKLQEAQERLKTAINKGDKTATKESNETQKILSEFAGLMGGIRDGLKNGDLGFGDAISAVGSGLAALSGPAAKLGGAIVGLATAVNGANQFMLQIGEDRFNLANEIRQSGLAASLTDAQSGLIGFSEMVNRTSFTLGQAAEFANKFSAAVGGAGIERSMQFVEDMAYGGAEGADMMRRFGLEFGGVANVAGQYLETVRNLGMLDRLNNQQLRGGMEEFMETVTVTSNIMKINIQDAAEMIASTLTQRDDLTAMLSTLPKELRANVQNVVAAFGGQGNQFAESIAQYVAAGGMQGFVRTQQGQQVLGSTLGQEFLPILQQIGDQLIAGRDQGQVLANSRGQLEGLVSVLQDSGFRAQVQGGEDQFLVQLAASVTRLLDNIGDADAGNRADTNRVGLEDDRTFVDRLMVQQEMVLAQENLLTKIGKAADYAENLAQRNADNLALINTVEEAGAQLIGSMGETVADITFGTESALTRFTTAIADAGTGLLSFVSEDMAIARELVQEQNRRAQEMLGIDSATIERNAEEAANAAAEKIRLSNIERTVGDNVVNGQKPMRQEFNEDLLAAALNLGNEIVPYRTTDQDGNAITENRISTSFTGIGQSYIPVSAAQLAKVEGEQRTIDEMRTKAGENELLESSFVEGILNTLTSGNLEDNAVRLANRFDVNTRFGSFDQADETTKAELKFLSDTIKSLENNKALTAEDYKKLLEAIEGMTVKDGVFGQNTEEHKKEIADLTAAIRQLVGTLQ